jgi:hypothetical protein
MTFLAALTLLSASTNAQIDAIDFTLDPRRDGSAEVVQFGLRYRDNSGPHQTTGPRAINLLSGLSAAQLSSRLRRQVAFTLANDAGVLTCRGAVANFRGAGTCRFQPLSSYLPALHAMGIGAPTPTEHLNLMWQNATIDYARAMAAHVRDLSSSNGLLLLAIHDISPNYVRTLSSLGYDKLTVDELVNLVVHEVDAEYIRRTMSRGEHPTIEQLVSRRMAEH